MTDEATARPFSPAELDAIEDALEQLQGEEAFALGTLPADGDALVRGRLARYRAISRLSHDVLHQYAAPSHVLDRVMALARETAGATPTVAPPEAATRPSWWARMRATWSIPMVAAAAALVLVVIITVPMGQRAEERAAAPVASNTPAPPHPETASSPAPIEPTEPRLAMGAKEAEDGDALEGLRGAAALEEAKAADILGKTQLDDRDADERLQRRRDSATTTTDALTRDNKPSREPKAPSAKPHSPAPKPAPTDTPAEPSKSGGGGGPGSMPSKGDTKNKDKDAAKTDTETLSRADAARRGGDCAVAVPLYESVRKSGTRKQRARALAGLALCAETAGEADRATDLLAKARAEDAEIDAYLETER